MAETQIIHAQLIRYSTSGDQIIVNLKNTGADVSVDASKRMISLMQQHLHVVL